GGSRTVPYGMRLTRRRRTDGHPWRRRRRRCADARRRVVRGRRRSWFRWLTWAAALCYPFDTLTSTGRRPGSVSSLRLTTRGLVDSFSTLLADARRLPCAGARLALLNLLNHIAPFVRIVDKCMDRTDTADDNGFR